MPERKTRNVSLPPEQDEFIGSLVHAGRYRTASEVVRNGLRMLQEAEHKRLPEKWLYKSLTSCEEGLLPPELEPRAEKHFADLLQPGLDDVAAGRVVDGTTAIERIRKKLGELGP